MDQSSWRTSLWPSYILLALVFGTYAVVTENVIFAIFVIALVWVLFTLLLTIGPDLVSRRWRLAGPAKWTFDRPLRAGIVAGFGMFVFILAFGGVPWKGAVLGSAYGSTLGLAGLIFRRRLRSIQ